MKKHSFVSIRRMHILLVLALLLCTLPALSCAKSNARLRNGTRISVLGDSISTYAGWSDLRPITGPECTYRYGEAYYGPKGGDYHNTDLLVSDTWWHQAAAQMGASILVSNAGNSSGLLYASYPSIPEWEHYLQDMLAWKTRPYYMGVGKVAPDIIALYIGSNDVARASLDKIGSVSDIDFNSLIKKSGKSYTYAEPTTVAEAYCILMHKLSVTYPKAEIYCFTVVPNSGGYLSTINKRLKINLPFNEMIKEVADHYGAFVVDIFDEFGVDPDYDGVATQTDLDTFKTYFNGDPHPNAKGFDVITKRFVSTVMENSRFVVGNRKMMLRATPPKTGTDTVEVESLAGVMETVEVNYTQTTYENAVTTTSEAVDYLTKRGMTVNYAGAASKYTYDNGLSTGSDESAYTSVNPGSGYWAEGGREASQELRAPQLEIGIELTEDAVSRIESGVSTAPQTTGDPKASADDGVYDYTTVQALKKGSLTVLTEAVQLDKKESTGSKLNYVTNEQTPRGSEGEGSNDMIVVEPMVLPQNKEDVPPIANTYDFVFIGSDKISHFYASFGYSSPDEAAYAGETPVYSGNGYEIYLRRRHSDFTNKGINCVVPHLYLNKDLTITAGDTWYPTWWASVQQFTLSDANGDIIHTYCADRDTPTIDYYSYRMENVSDADYYDAEEARMLRYVAQNGYWGANSGFGSLSAVKDMMRKSGKFTDEEINALTDGLAMTATQYAIWTLSDRMDATMFINAYYTAHATDFYPADSEAQLANKDKVALIFKLFFHLIESARDAVEPAPDTSHTVITEKNFLKDVRLRITDKPADHKNNLDSETNNDVYRTDLAFTLGVMPLDGNDDNLVAIIEDAHGNVLASGRIAGDLKSGERRLTRDENGRYTFTNLLLMEGGQDLIVRLSGTQDLRKDVYLFSSEVKNGESSQTLVGVAEGDYGVNVQMSLLFSLDVEDDVFSIERVWRDERILPNSPKTGDSSTIRIWLCMLFVSCAGAALCLLSRKRIR